MQTIRGSHMLLFFRHREEDALYAGAVAYLIGLAAIVLFLAVTYWG
jgi:hypothetical protein